MINAGIEGRWADCLFELAKIEQLSVASSATASIRLYCNEARRISSGQLPDYNDAVVVYDSIRALLEDARFDPTVLTEQRGTMLANIDWLSSNGFETLANDVHSQFRTAVGESANGTLEAE